ncbi:MAG: single-stranded DNA-binding protein [Bdellovibrionaceae bacterium]|nr:single-stranded DNA-binding protein [Pseudobdellovibrionaceae bacterium]MDW8190087.1 single-stranded DNA-binding protein [Pseudobdellovibrionaceae bacterium]
MSGVNKVILVGRLGGEPEMKTLNPQQTVTRFSVATSETWVDKMGAKQERTEWHRVVTWGKLAETCARYLQKGRLVYVEGRLQTRQWEDANGQKRYTTEIVANTVQFLGAASSDKLAEVSNVPEFEPQVFQDLSLDAKVEDQIPF